MNTYLICHPSKKDKLTVIQKVTQKELKQVELLIHQAKKYLSEWRTWHETNKRATNAAIQAEWIRINSEFTEFSKGEQFSLNDTIDKYVGAIIIPYTKMLE